MGLCFQAALVNDDDGTLQKHSAKLRRNLAGLGWCKVLAPGVECQLFAYNVALESATYRRN